MAECRDCEESAARFGGKLKSEAFSGKGSLGIHPPFLYEVDGIHRRGYPQTGDWHLQYVQ